jgi:hypothetical protein
MHKHANTWWSLQLHTLCAIHTASLFPALGLMCGDCQTVAVPLHGAAPHQAVSDLIF